MRVGIFSGPAAERAFADLHAEVLASPPMAGAAWRAPADWLARAAVLAVGVYLLSFLARSFQAESLAQRWLLPMPYPSLPSEPCDLDGRTIFCPAEISYTQCWYGPFPCVPSARSDVYLRGSDFADGFSAYPRGE